MPEIGEEVILRNALIQENIGNDSLKRFYMQFNVIKYILQLLYQLSTNPETKQWIFTLEKSPCFVKVEFRCIARDF